VVQLSSLIYGARLSAGSQMFDIHLVFINLNFFTLNVFYEAPPFFSLDAYYKHYFL
jgi:hypothetical protein